MLKNIIIHFPFKIDRERAAASQLRPVKIVETFRQMGYKVWLVEGYGAERSRQIKEIKVAVKSGEKFEFVYSECNTSPTLLTEKHHYPTYPFLDFSFFKFCRQHEIPIGLFYRDIYWCFPENNKGLIRKAMKLFYRYDLHEYNKYVSALFVPSFEMVEHIPFNLKMPIHELYPGCEVKSSGSTSGRDGSRVNILYVGGIGHHYDVSMMLEVVQKLPQVHLTLCCRPDDWAVAKSDYEKYLCENISVVHKSGKDLEQLYADADLFCLFVRPDKYWKFAVPFKLFETIGYGCPVLSSEGTWVSKFVRENGVGYTSGYNPEALKDTLEQIVAHGDALNSVKERVCQIRSENTWEARCRKIEDVLLKRE